MSETLPDLPTYCWPVDWSADPGALTLDPLIRDRSEVLAVSVLRTLTAGRVGGCPVTVNPRLTYTRGTWTAAVEGRPSHFFPYLHGGAWLNGVTCGGTCPQPPAVPLPPPVGRVDEVQIQGGTLAPTAYRVEGSALVRTDGGTWPVCDSTFLVTYLQGAPVDGLASYVAGILATEFAKAQNGGKCRLPSGVTSVAREGISYEVAGGMFESGMTGIREVDAWVATWNPHRLISAPGVYSPDLYAPRVR